MSDLINTERAKSSTNHENYTVEEGLSSVVDERQRFIQSMRDQVFRGGDMEIISKEACKYYNETMYHPENFTNPALQLIFGECETKEEDCVEKHGYAGGEYSYVDAVRTQQNYNNFKCLKIDSLPKQGGNQSLFLGTTYRRNQVNTNKRVSCCHFCGKHFSKSNLKSHLRRHTGERPFKCLNCGKDFADKGNLNTHMRIHTGDRPFRCLVPTCSSSFRAQSHLNDHMKAHLNVRPYKCSECKRSFTRANTLNTHKRTHTGEKPYECKHCFQKFTESGNLRMHLVTHSEDRPYRCPFEGCERTFKRKSNLKEHMLTKMHKQEMKVLKETNEISKFKDILGDNDEEEGEYEEEVLIKRRIKRGNMGYPLDSFTTAEKIRKPSFVDVFKKEEDFLTCANTPEDDNIDPCQFTQGISKFSLENDDIQRDSIYC